MKLTEKILEGDVQSAARLMRGLEDGVPSASKELKTIYHHTGKAYIVGLTGSPGVGKSTLIGGLIDVLRKRELTVGVVAIDPTSPFTGGAILADRIRMQQRSMDKDVFIKSMATRGWVGGLSKATLSMIHVMDAMGKDIILIETVGAGQAEVEITKVADTSVVILSPMAGDEMQMMKAGIMEIADIFVVNKADKEGANIVASAIEAMLEMKTCHSGEWRPPVVLTEAVSDRGIGQLVDEIFKHKEFLISTGKLEESRRKRASLELNEAVKSFLRDYVYQEIDKGGYLEKLVDDLARRKINPPSAALKIITKFTKQFNPPTTQPKK